MKEDRARSHLAFHNPKRFFDFPAPLIAAQEALHDAGIAKETSAGFSEEINPKRSDIAVGTVYGGVESLTDGAAALINLPGKRLSSRLLSKSLPNAAAVTLAKKYCIRGPVMTYTTACAASANAIEEAMHWLKRGEVDVMLAGGAEYLFSPVVLAGLHSAGALITEEVGDKGTWSKPFDVNRKGMAPGEGAAFLFLETAAHAPKKEELKHMQFSQGMARLMMHIMKRLLNLMARQLLSQCVKL